MGCEDGHLIALAFESQTLKRNERNAIPRAWPKWPSNYRSAGKEKDTRVYQESNYHNRYGIFPSASRATEAYSFRSRSAQEPSWIENLSTASHIFKTK